MENPVFVSFVSDNNIDGQHPGQAREDTAAAAAGIQVNQLAGMIQQKYFTGQPHTAFSNIDVTVYSIIGLCFHVITNSTRVAPAGMNLVAWSERGAGKCGKMLTAFQFQPQNLMLWMAGQVYVDSGDDKKTKPGLLMILINHRIFTCLNMLSFWIHISW